MVCLLYDDLQRLLSSDSLKNQTGANHSNSHHALSKKHRHLPNDLGISSWFICDGTPSEALLLSLSGC